MKKLLLVPAVVALCAGPAAAQTDLEGLVNVNIQDVLQDIAIDLNVEENNIPVTLQVPVSVAANVCDVDVGVLSAQLDTGDATCAAVTGSQELTQVVQQEMNAGSTDDTASDDSGTDDGTAGDDTASDDSGTDDGTAGDDTASDDSGTDDGTAGDDTASDDSGTDDGTDVADDVTDGETDDTTTSSTNSAREFAPGQQDQPANEVAPGKQDDPRAAAPGQVKKCAPDEAPCE